MTFRPGSDSRVDGRWIVLSFLILYFSAIFIASFYTDYDQFWANTFRVCTSRPRFLDMHHLTSGLDCHRLGYDVLRQNPCEPNKLPMTYPRIWLNLAVLGINQSHSDLLGITCAMLYFVCVFIIAGRLTILEGFFYGVILCSPSLMLAVETGNIDLIIFILLSGVLLLLARNRALSYFFILFAALLKYFPISALLVALKDRSRRMLLLVALLLGIFAVYIYFTFEEVRLIHSQVQRSTYLSFGGFILFRILHHLLNETGSLIPWRIAFVAAAMGVAAVAYLLSRRTTITPNVDFIDGFRMTAGIYITVFLLWDNWDYRFIFLIFALPQMWHWIRLKDPMASTTSYALLAIPLTLWLSSGGCPPEMNFRAIRNFFVDEVINWFLFFYFVYGVMVTGPALFRRYNKEAR